MARFLRPWPVEKQSSSPRGLGTGRVRFCGVPLSGPVGTAIGLKRIGADVEIGVEIGTVTPIGIRAALGAGMALGTRSTVGTGVPEAATGTGWEKGTCCGL